MPRDCLNKLMLMPEPLPSSVPHPLVYLEKISNARKLIGAVADMPYPADPITEQHLMGLTYLQVGLLKQAESMAVGNLESLEFFTDRMIGRPAQVNVNVNAGDSYTDFLKKIAEAEGDVVDIRSEPANELGL